MKLKIYSIYDQDAKAFMRPFLLVNDGLAIRTFQDQINAEEANPLSTHPDKFTLYYIGEFDDHDANLENIDPISLGNGKQYVIDSRKPDQQLIVDVVRECILELQNEANKVKELNIQ
jgi:hypothetical protein